MWILQDSVLYSSTQFIKTDTWCLTGESITCDVDTKLNLASAKERVDIISPNPVRKIAEKTVCRSVFLTKMALYFECRIKKKRTPSDSMPRKFEFRRIWGRHFNIYICSLEICIENPFKPFLDINRQSSGFGTVKTSRIGSTSKSLNL